MGEGLVDPAESLAPALRRAWRDTISLLFRPFDGRRWIKLGIVCFFLGGGMPWAALDWPLGALTPDGAFHSLSERARIILAFHPWFAIPIILLALAIGITLFYVRTLGRFVLVDSIIGRGVHVRRAWISNRKLGRSYFGFLTGTLLILGSAFGIVTLALFPSMQSWAIERAAWFPAFLAGLLGTVVLVGAALALGITLTDDFVVPAMYAERAGLPKAWGQILRLAGREPATFGIYILVRIGLAVVTGALELLVLFPVLLVVFSGTWLVRAAGTLVLNVLGIAWAWNTATLSLAVTGTVLLSGVLLIALSLAQMPAQIFLQAFGIQFIGSSIPSLGALLNPAADDDQPGDQTLSA